MKHFVIAIAALIVALATQAGENKRALLMVHFGTTHDDTRAVTIDAINEKAKEIFPDMYVAEAYTSRIVIKRLKQRGVTKDTPLEALLKLAAAGYTDVFVQNTNIIDGIEVAALRDEVERMAPFFTDIRMGLPLLYSVDDGLAAVRILSELYPQEKKTNYLFVGHGTESSANAVYSQIDYMFSAAGREDCRVITIEGYPVLENVLPGLKAGGVKNVVLVPLMFVAGDHARNDMASDMKKTLESLGFKTSAVMEGLGQMEAVQNRFMEHIRAGLKSRPLSPSEHKRNFSAK